MFVRVYREREQKELLINLDSVWKIEVTYGIPGDNGSARQVTLNAGLKNPKALRYYRVFVGDEKILLEGHPDDPVIKVFEDIYKKAAKGPPEASADA
jgi:hypothetical protein